MFYFGRNVSLLEKSKVTESQFQRISMVFRHHDENSKNSINIDFMRFIGVYGELRKYRSCQSKVKLCVDFVKNRKP